MKTRDRATEPVSATDDEGTSVCFRDGLREQEGDLGTLPPAPRSLARSSQLASTGRCSSPLPSRRVSNGQASRAKRTRWAIVRRGAGMASAAWAAACSWRAGRTFAHPYQGGRPHVAAVPSTPPNPVKGSAAQATAPQAWLPSRKPHEQKSAVLLTQTSCLPSACEHDGLVTGDGGRHKAWQTGTTVHCVPAEHAAAGNG